MPPPVFRFAPSPNGYLHLGHAYSALLNFDLARQAGGSFLLRIEDIDADALPAGIRGGDLRGPRPGSASPGRRRCGGSRSISRDYRAARRETVGAGPDLSRFREPRRDRAAGGAARDGWRLAARSRRRAALSGRRQSRCRRTSAPALIASGAPYALRLDMAAALRARRAISPGPSRAKAPTARPAWSPPGREAWGDVILARKETPTSYHLSVVIDDALQGVTDVVRGAGPVLVDQRAPLAAASARPAAAGLPPPPADPRRGGAKAVEVDRRDRLARIARAGADAGRYPPAWSDCR